MTNERYHRAAADLRVRRSQDTPTTHTDDFGNVWPYGRGYENEYCKVCGQPDNCGDCSHDPLDATDVLALGGKPSIATLETYATEHELGEGFA